MTDPLDAYADATRVSPARQARLRERLAARLGPAPHETRPPWGRRWLLVPAIALLAIGFLFPGTHATPEPVTRTFDTRGEAALGDAVHVSWDGTGAAAGDTRDLHLTWEAGSLGVEVTPDAGVQLEVTTGEARIRVVGTGFDVRRDAFGTAVDVRHGKVVVACVSATSASPAPENLLTSGQSTECLPVTPAALLGRARAQERRGDSAEAVLATLAGVAPATRGPVAAEIALVRVSELTRAGRPADALTAAEAALRAGDPGRRTDLLRLATRLAVDLGGCARAPPHVAAPGPLGEPTPCAPDVP